MQLPWPVSSHTPPLRGAVARPAAPSSRRPAAFTSGLAFRCAPLPSPAVSAEELRSCRGLFLPPSPLPPDIQAAVSATGPGPPGAASPHRWWCTAGFNVSRGGCPPAPGSPPHPDFTQSCFVATAGPPRAAPPPPYPGCAAASTGSPPALPGGCSQGPRSRSSVRVLHFGVCFVSTPRSPMPPHPLRAASAR